MPASTRAPLIHETTVDTTDVYAFPSSAGFPNGARSSDDFDFKPNDTNGPADVFAPDDIYVAFLSVGGTQADASVVPDLVPDPDFSIEPGICDGECIL